MLITLEVADEKSEGAKKHAPPAEDTVKLVKHQYVYLRRVSHYNYYQAWCKH